MDIYKPEELKEEAAKNMMIVDTAVEVQAVVKLLVAKGIIANVEMDYMRQEIKNSPTYKAAYEMAKKAVNLAELYEKDPQAYLRGLLGAKLNGTIK